MPSLSSQNHWAVFKLAFKHWLRDLYSNEKRLLILATLLAAVSMAMISSFSDRLQRTMNYRASELIAGDVTIFSTRPIPSNYVQKSGELDLNHSEAIGFSTMAYANNQLQLVRIRAVQDNYPLKGYNQVAMEFFGEGQLLAKAPALGKVWAEERILQKLGAKVGDDIEIGDGLFTIEKILQQDADRSGSLFSPFGRILMNKEDVPKTAVVNAGSRIWYKHYYTGNEDNLEQFIEWLRPQLDKAERLGGIEDSQNNVGNALQKAQQYLSLASLISVLLAAVAIALCAQRYSERHFNTAALLRCLGASARQVRNIFIYKLVLTALVAAVMGALIGYGLHFLLLELVADILPKDIKPARILPVLMSMLSAAMVLLMIALAPILNLNKVSPVRVLRRELAPPSVKANVFFILAVGVMVVLAYLLTSSIKLALVFVVGLAILLLLYGLLSTIFLTFMSKVLSAGSALVPNILQVGLNQLNRHQYYARSQVAAFSFIFTAVALIWIVRGDLFENWQQQVPEGTPNHFAINILPDRKDDFAKALENKNIELGEFYPMVRGRLSHINGKTVEELFPEDDAPNAINRELNLTWADSIGEGQKLLEGKWFDYLPSVNGDEEPENWVSLESGLAKRLGLSIGDQLQFNIAGSQLNAKVGNVREVKWESFQPNFYMVFAPNTIESFHHTYITSFYLPPNKTGWLLEFNQAFKAITIIEIQQILNQVREILGQTSMAVEAILVLVLLCAMVLMFATLLSTLSLRKHEAALYRTFGASEAMIRYRIRAEYITLALMASLLALVSFEAISAALYVFIFNVAWQAHMQLWLAIPALALGSILISGYYANRDVLKASPVSLLQEIS